MSRLYAWTANEKSVATKTGNKFIDVQINWGSANNSKKAIRVIVRWEEGEEKPQVHFTNYLESDKRV